MKYLILIFLVLIIFGCETQKVEEIKEVIPQVTENSDQSYILIGNHAFNQSMITDFRIAPIEINFYEVKIRISGRTFSTIIFKGSRKDCLILLEEILTMLADKEA